MALEPITRQEKIIAGRDLTPITRLEKFLKNFGGSGGGGGAQPDLSQTDINQPDYVKGVIRQESLPEGYPYKEGEKHEIVWDGNTEGLKNIEQFGLYLVSDAIISNDACKQGIVYLSDGSTVTVESMWDNIVTNGVVTDDFCCFDLVYVIRTAGVNIMGVTFDTPGVYFSNSGGMYVTKFTAEAETVHQMVQEFLPLLTSPNGTKYRLTVADDGTLSAVAQS